MDEQSGKREPESAEVISAEELKQRVGGLPREPGVYIMRDKSGAVIYVGKARNLRSRVRSYFTKSGDTRYFVRLLDKILSRIDFIVTANEKEAVLLEANLIKRHRPRYNIKLRDDKNYLLIRVEKSKEFPRLEVVRRFRKDNAKYFGPYHSARSARAAARFASRHFHLRICSDRDLKSRSRPCIQFHMGRCPAPCTRDVDAGEYRAQLDKALLFLLGRRRELLVTLREQMEEASELLEFERAARYRDVIQAVEKVVEPQNVITPRAVDQDVFGLARDKERVEICVLEVRSGRLVGRRSFLLKRQEFPDEEVLSSFVVQYYMAGRLPPGEVLLSHDIDDEAPLAAVLSEKKSGKVTLKRPKRGRKRRLIEMASRNARESLVRRTEGPDSYDLIEALAARLRLSKVPHRMECFDISHLSGGEVRASMVVFWEGEPASSLYRQFKINGASSGDDYESMREVLERRVRRAAEERAGWELPDLLVLDGGRGQLGVALGVLEELGVSIGAEGVEVVAIAKGEVPSLKERRDVKAKRAAERGQEYRVVREKDHLYRPQVKDPIPVKGRELLMLAHLRDEAHRFAVASHRKARRKKALTGGLEDIPGVGPARHRKLLDYFGSLSEMEEAEVAELKKAGLPQTIAERVWESFHSGTSGDGSGTG